MAELQSSKRFRLPWSRAAASEERREAHGPAADWRETIRARLVIAAIGFVAWTVAIEARLVYLQVYLHADMMERAERQQLRTIDAPAKRGDIIDRNGNLFAYSVDADSIFADPSAVEDPARTAALVCGALKNCDATDRQAMLKNLRRPTQFAYLARKVGPDEERRVRELDLKGVYFLKESRRFYPKRELLAHVLGYVGLDNAGLAGLEATYDRQIRGRPGQVLVHIDGRRQAVFRNVEEPPTAGAALELSVDQYLQNIVERELRAGVMENRAASGSAVVMDPASGEILAMASWPTFNPNTYGSSSEDARRNRVVQDLYEPGSTFKIVTASAALEEGVMDPDDPIDVSAGMIRFGARRIDDVHRYGVLSFTDVLVKSSNVGAIKVGLRLGPERLGRYISRFGFGQAIAPDFRGESPGIVWNPARLDQSALASVSMGYQVGVTPIQMAAAVSAVANGGTLHEPRIVRAFIKDGRRTPVERKVLRRAISEETAAELTAIMEEVVERGTATTARIDGYTIAGKTGTAAKLVGGRYSTSDYNASFVGFVPSRKPALTIIVVIDSPHAKGYYGGVVAAPVFRRIAEASLRHLGIPPTVNPMPPVLVTGPGSSREGMAPQPVAASVTVPRPADPVQDGLMPDLRGLSARDAARALALAGMTVRISGQGVVADQAPAAGTPLIPGTVAVLKLDRKPPVADGATQ